MLRDQLLQLATGFDAYRSNLRVDKHHAIHRLLKRDIPDTLKAITPNADAFKLDGSDGLANVTAVPWVATFHREITASATTGYYVVWLLPEDRRSLILELGLGATQFAQLYGENKNALAAAGRAAMKVLRLAKPLLSEAFPSELLARTVEGELPPLGKSYEHKAYGKAAVLSVRYLLDDLPPNRQIESDYIAFINLYQRLVSSALTPTTDELVVDEVVAATDTGALTSAIHEVRDFTPRVRTTHHANSEARSVSARRHSKVSKKIGDLGERLVLEFLRNELRRLGKSELADRVVWHQESEIERTPGWDITAYDPTTEEPLFVEVKASQSATINEVILTAKEWEAARRHGQRYHLYLVTDVLQIAPKLEVLKDPAYVVERGEAKVAVESWALNFSKRGPTKNVP